MDADGFTTIVWYEGKMNCRLNIYRNIAHAWAHTVNVKKMKCDTRFGMSCFSLSLSFSRPSIGTCSPCTVVHNVHVIGHMMSSGYGRWFSIVDFSKNQFDSQEQIRRAESNWANGEMWRWTLDADRIQCTLHEACVYRMCIRMRCRVNASAMVRVSAFVRLKIAKTWEKLSSMDDFSLSHIASCVRRSCGDVRYLAVDQE